MEIRSNPERFPDYLVGFAGTCSYRSKFFNGYVNEQRVSMAQRNLLAQAPKLKGIDFEAGSYLDLDCGTGNTIVCDPPYRETTKYRAQSFDHEEFYEWCATQKANGNVVYVCEYDAPFECVWERPITNYLSRKAVKATERLFRV